LIEIHAHLATHTRERQKRAKHTPVSPSSDKMTLQCVNHVTSALPWRAMTGITCWLWPSM